MKYFSKYQNKDKIVPPARQITVGYLGRPLVETYYFKNTHISSNGVVGLKVECFGAYTINLKCHEVTVVVKSVFLKEILGGYKMIFSDYFGYFETNFKIFGVPEFRKSSPSTKTIL